MIHLVKNHFCLCFFCVNLWGVFCPPRLDIRINTPPLPDAEPSSRSLQCVARGIKLRDRDRDSNQICADPGDHCQSSFPKKLSVIPASSLQASRGCAALHRYAALWEAVTHSPCDDHRLRLGGFPYQQIKASLQPKQGHLVCMESRPARVCFSSQQRVQQPRLQDFI